MGTEMKDTCIWDYDIIDDYFWTSCLHAFVFNEGTPTENNFVFCPFCGKHIDEDIEEGETLH